MNIKLLKSTNVRGRRTHFGTATRHVSKYSESWMTSSLDTTPMRDRTARFPLCQGVISVCWIATAQRSCSRPLTLHLNKRALYKIIVVEL